MKLLKSAKLINKYAKLDSAVKVFMRWCPIDQVPRRVLDLGARDGYTTKKLTKKGYNVTGTDIDQKCIRYCKERGRNVIYDDIMHTNLKQNSFDAVFGRHVLEHIHDTRRFFEICKGLLKPTGIVFFIFPLEKKREIGKHQVFFPSIKDFKTPEGFNTLYLGLSKEMGIKKFSFQIPEALYIGRIK